MELEAAAVAAELFLCCFPLVCFSISISIPPSFPQPTSQHFTRPFASQGGRMVLRTQRCRAPAVALARCYLSFLVYRQLPVDCHETTQQAGLNKAAEIVVRQTPPTVD